MAASVRDMHSVEGCHSTTENGKPSSRKSDSCTTISSRGHRLRRAYLHQDEQRARRPATSRDAPSLSSEGRKIAHVATSEGIHWHFNPPSAPHFGGLWEAAVKSAKYHLRRTIETRLTFEEMSTLLAQVEITCSSAPLLTIPEPSLSDKKENLLSRWQLVQRMRDHFWQRWSREYLHTLATRPKWTKDSLPPRIGSLCIIRSELSPPNKWPLAWITQLHPGDDGMVRVVTVKTASSELIRPLVKLVLLPEDANAFISHANVSNVKESLNLSRVLS
ncbi:PREDICTED: uncharacterized protein LOC105149514 [Acromyrmex echinatior]|uniref:uncharacterized protein LOC105149514 n=1 Tax=Acromyrmex echinatior TaxID=103372 RepID=UPI000580BD35|nr:PREDICTED: uncharacterized protein LOC105149514 [Acromyrmex echinatior]